MAEIIEVLEVQSLSRFLRVGEENAFFVDIKRASGEIELVEITDSRRSIKELPTPLRRAVRTFKRKEFGRSIIAFLTH